jgi:MSHA biogenesis protein MshP
MCPDRPAGAQRGFALMAALFIIVTLAAIGLYLLTVSAGQVAAASQDEQAARAYQAARTGIEWGAYEILIAGSCPASQNLALAQNFKVEIVCEAAPAESEGSASITTYKVTATGCNDATCPPAAIPATYVERRLQLTLSKCTAGC